MTAAQALMEAARRVARAPALGVWVVRGPDGWGVSRPVPPGSSLLAGGDPILWLEIRPHQIPDWPEAWGSESLLEAMGVLAPGACGGRPDCIRRALQALAEDESAEAGRIMDLFLHSALLALAWAELVVRVWDLPEGPLREELLEGIREAQGR